MLCISQSCCHKPITKISCSMALLCSDFYDKRRGEIYCRKGRPELFLAKVSTMRADIFKKICLKKSHSQICGHTDLSLLNGGLNSFLVWEEWWTVKVVSSWGGQKPALLSKPARNIRLGRWPYQSDAPGQRKKDSILWCSKKNHL